MLKLLGRILVWVAAIAVVLIGAGLGYRAWRVNEADAALTISSPNGIDEAMFVPINGSEQWVTIRGQDRKNPVVLVIHGGPGTALAPFAAPLLAYEQRYTLVQWDQPGAAKTFRRAGNELAPGMTIDSVVRDGVAVAEFVKTHLGADKMILLGWSWGSIIGVEMARQRPDLFAAYVGTGQIADLQAGEALVYSRVLAKARAQRNADAIRELEAVGPPPYDSTRELETQRKWASTLAGEPPAATQILRQLAFAPRYSLIDVASYLRGVLASSDHFFGSKMDGPAFDVDLAATATVFEIPVIFIQGSEDDFTPAELARGYLDSLTAPQKAYVSIEGAGHMALIANSDRFLAALNERVRTLAAAD